MSKRETKAVFRGKRYHEILISEKKEGVKLETQSSILSGLKEKSEVNRQGASRVGSVHVE